MRLLIWLPNAFSVENRRQPLAVYLCSMISFACIGGFASAQRWPRTSRIGKVDEGYRCPHRCHSDCSTESGKLRHYLQLGVRLTLGSARQQNGGPAGSGRKQQETPEDPYDESRFAERCADARCHGKGIPRCRRDHSHLDEAVRRARDPSTEHSRRTYREMLFTSRGASEFMSGVIMHDETIRQKEFRPHAAGSGERNQPGRRAQSPGRPVSPRASASGPGAGGMAWQGREPGCRPARFCQRARANGAATVGQYTDEMEAASPGADDPPHAATGGTTDTPAHSYPIGAMRS
jgi:Fructose-bisphosphate aldolase class-I